MMRVLTLLVAFPVAVVLVSLAIANRHSVRFVLDPFRPEAPALAIDLPFYVYVFGALMLGVAIGGIATWLGHGRWRRLARERLVEARRWQAEADRLGRERDEARQTSLRPASASTAAAAPLALTGRR